MSLKLLTALKLDDWNNYLKGTLGNLLRALRKELVEVSGVLNVTKVVEVVYYFSSMMERFLSYYSPEATRFAPKFPRYFFFDVAADGSLYLIVSTIFKYCIERKNTSISLAKLTFKEFRELYNMVYNLLVEQGVHDMPKIHLNVPDGQKEELTASIITLKGKVLYIPEDSTCSVRPQPKNSFCPAIPAEFRTYKQRALSAAINRVPIDDDSPAFSPEQIDSPVVDLLTAQVSTNFFLRMVEPPEGNKKQGDTLVHVRCIPHDYDFVMHSRNLQAIRSRQIGASAAASLSLDEYPASAFLRPKVKPEQQTVGVYIETERRGPILVPPQYITDSLFFNEWLDPYDYITSTQEAKISMTQLGLAADQLAVSERPISRRASSLPSSKSVASMLPDAGSSTPMMPSAMPQQLPNNPTSIKHNTTILAQNVEALLHQITQLAPGPTTQLHNNQLNSVQLSSPMQQYQYAQHVHPLTQYPPLSNISTAHSMNMGKRSAMARGPPPTHLQYRSHPLATSGQVTILRGFEMLLGSVVIHRNTVVLSPNSNKMESFALRYSNQDVLKSLGLLLAGLPVCEGPTPLFSDLLKSRMVGRPRREDFNVQTLMLTAKMRRFLEYGDSTSSLLNIYVKYNQNKRSTVTINIQELCASMRGHPIPIIWYRRVDPLFSANLSILYYNIKLNNTYISNLNDSFKTLRSRNINELELYTRSLHDFRYVLEGHNLMTSRSKQSVIGVQGAMKTRHDDQDASTRIQLSAVLENMRNFLVFDPHYSPIAQHACLCFSPQHAGTKKQNNSISLEEQAYFSKLHAFDWQSYITCRNTIIAAWRCRPQLYLTLDACKSALRLDYNYIQSVHTYLEKKKIINDPAIVIMSTVPPITNTFEDPLQLLIEKELMLRARNKLNPFYCGECKANVATEYYNISVSRQYPHSRLICEACYRKILAIRGEKVAGNYNRIDTSRDLDKARREKDGTSILSGWTSVEQFILLNTVRRVISENRGFFSVFDYVSKQLNKAPEVCLQAYLAITSNLFEPYETTNYLDILDAYVRRLEQEICSSKEFGTVVQHLKSKFNISTAESMYIAIMGKSRILARVEKSRALSELHSAIS